jgi:hypothetical protein
MLDQDNRNKFEYLQRLKEVDSERARLHQIEQANRKKQAEATKREESEYL